MVLEENVFITQALHATTLSTLSDADYDIYAAPYPTPESRRPLLEWARSSPIGGEPVEMVARVEAYDAWLANSDDVPKLLLTFDSSPTLIVGPELTAWCAANIANLEVVACGPAGHMAAEDQPEAIAAAILEKLGRFLTASR
jgi:haloalkane dehalogenase